MPKVGISVDYSNICKDYNTVYLDRDNSDPQTVKCMKKVLQWSKDFLSELLAKFSYSPYYVSSQTEVTIDDISSKRFLFYSLEKEITLQSYVIKKEYTQYDSLADWEQRNSEGLLIQNDADGGAVHFFTDENSEVYQWIINKLKDFSLDEVPFEAK